MLPKKYLLAFLVILVFQITLLMIFVFLRLIDFDEGLYLSAAYQVKSGKLPYLDFFYNQMPYLPYAYSLVAGAGFSSIFWGRLISAIASLFLGILLFCSAHKLSRDTEVSLFIFFLYSFHGLILAWHSTVKTSTFSDLWSFISFIFFTSYVISQKQEIKNFMVFLSGIFIGLALNFRLTHLVVLISEGILIFLLFHSESMKRRIYDFVLLFFGAVLSSSFTIYLFFKNPQVFIFDNLIFRQAWGSEVIKMSFMSKLFTLAKFLVYPQDLFILILVALSLVYLLGHLKKTHNLTSENKIMVTSASLALSILLVSFFISPTQFQYFEQTLPFLLIACIPALRKLKSKWLNKKSMVWVITVSYLLFIFPFVFIFIFGVREKDEQFHLKQVRKVVEVIQENSDAKERILALWPGYTVLSGRDPLPGLETGGWEVAHLFSSQELKESKVINREKMEEVVLEKQVSLIVGWDWFVSELGALLDVNYRHVKTIGKVEIYKVK